MHRSIVSSAAMLVSAAIFAAGSAYAEKPEWAGKGNKHRKDKERGENRDQDSRAHFEDRHRVVVREYYGSVGREGRCPPGLAKKHNGCMPPGQAKKWRMGQPLPREVVFYEVPPKLVVELGRPPAGYKYVRVAGDILLIAVGTALVVDAIQDLGRI